jgi:multiple sugar transport system permease protein
LRRFDIIWILTEGGPVEKTTTLVIKLYREAFYYSRLGSAAAMGMVGFALSVLLTFVYFRANKKVEESM